MIDYIPHTKIQKVRMKVIERHSSLLAKDLAEIDRLTCPKCPDSIMDETRLLHDETVFYEKRSCPSCGYEEVDDNS